MHSRYHIQQKDHPRFVTGSVVAWLPVFTSAARCDILVEALASFRAQKRLEVYGWVIMDSCFRAVLRAPRLPAVLADLKRFTARRSIEQLEQEACGWLLNQFRRQRTGPKGDGLPQVWQGRSHPEPVMDDRTMEQKLDYLHHLPVKQGLVASPEHWRYSSAHGWLPGAYPLLQVDNWRAAAVWKELRFRKQALGAD